MKLLVLFSSVACLTSPALGIDIIAFLSLNSCSGGMQLRCSSIVTNRCCAVGSGNFGSNSTLYTDMGDSTWVMGYHQAGDNKCADYITSLPTQGGTVCVTIGRGLDGWSGLAYFAGVKRRSAGGIDEPEKCTGSVEPDTFIAKDGTEFDLTEMPEGQKARLVELAATAGFTGYPPADYDAFRRNIKAKLPDVAKCL